MGNGGFARPRAGTFAAVPVTSCCATAGGTCMSDGSEASAQGEEGDGFHGSHCWGLVMEERLETGREVV